MMMEALPAELLTVIFSYLPRRERFVCMCMSDKWKEAMDCAELWRHMCIRLDVDFFDVSTIQLTIEYCKYIQSLELKFEYPEEPVQWINYRMLDITKRTYRFLSIFVQRNLQITQLTFSNFCDFYRSKKILYYLSMFLRSQYRIKIISCNGSYFTKRALLKILSASVAATESSIEHLDIRNCYQETDSASTQASQQNILSQQFMICLTNVYNLRIFKIDLEALVVNGILEGLLKGSCENLELLEMRVTERDTKRLSKHGLLKCNLWIDMKKKFPKLRVSINFCDVLSRCEFVDCLLVSTTPLQCVSWTAENDTILKDFYEAVAKRYSKSLEVVKIITTSQPLDDLILCMIENCCNLKMIEFAGIISECRKELIENLNQENFVIKGDILQKSVEEVKKGLTVTGKVLRNTSAIMNTQND